MLAFHGFLNSIVLIFFPLAIISTHKMTSVGPASVCMHTVAVLPWCWILSKLFGILNHKFSVWILSINVWIFHHYKIVWHFMHIRPCAAYFKTTLCGISCVWSFCGHLVCAGIFMWSHWSQQNEAQNRNFYIKFTFNSAIQCSSKMLSI